MAYKNIQTIQLLRIGQFIAMPYHLY
jgi:hypothetical protein